MASESIQPNANDDSELESAAESKDLVPVQEEDASTESLTLSEPEHSGSEISEQATGESPKSPTAPTKEDLEQEKLKKIYDKGIENLKAGHVEDAVIQFQSCLNINPNYAPAHAELGYYYQAKGHAIVALRYFQSFLENTPKDTAQAPVLSSVGQILLLERQYDSALQALKSAIQFDPNYALSYHHLGEYYLKHRQMENARFAFDRFLELEQPYVWPLQNYYAKAMRAQALAYLGQHENALESLKPEHDGDPIQMEQGLCVPIIFESETQIAQEMNRLENHWDTLASPDSPLDHFYPEVVYPRHFRMAQNGENPRALFQKVSQVMAAYHATETPQFADNEFRLLRVGVFGSFQKGFVTPFVPLLEKLNHEFELMLFSTQHMPNELSHLPQAQFLQLPLFLNAQIQKLKNMDLDILVFLDIGAHDPYGYHLAHYPLAPLQFVLDGAPHTTGIQNLDFYVSSQYRQLDKDHFTEKLHTLQGTLMDWPLPPEEWIPQRAFKMPQNTDHFYGCAISPEHLSLASVKLFGTLLETDPKGILCLFQSPYSELNERFIKLLRQQWPPQSIERLRFLPHTQGLPLYSYLKYLPVILDGAPQGGYHYQALNLLSHGNLIVTQKNDSLLAGLYAQAELDECLANSPEDYIQKAISLSTNAVLRSEAKTRVQALIPPLLSFEDYFRGFRSLLRDHCKRQF